jgi:hypothetical protein
MTPKPYLRWAHTGGVTVPLADAIVQAGSRARPVTTSAFGNAVRIFRRIGHARTRTPSVDAKVPSCSLATACSPFLDVLPEPESHSALP